MRKDAGQRAPALRRIADAKTSRDLAAQATALEVGHGTWAGAKLGAVEVCRLVQQLRHREPPLTELGAPHALFSAHVFLRYLHAHLLGQVLHRVDKTHAGMFGEEAKSVTAGAAAKAVIKLLGRADRKARRLFGMEWAQAHQVGAATLELDMAPHHVDDIYAREQFLQKAGRNHPGSLAAAAAAEAGVSANMPR